MNLLESGCFVLRVCFDFSLLLGYLWTYHS